MTTLNQIFGTAGQVGAVVRPKIITVDSQLDRLSFYLVDLRNGAINVTLPDNVLFADWIKIGDLAGVCSKDLPITIISNTHKIHGSDRITITNPNAVVTFQYINNEFGWKIVEAMGY